MWCEYEGDTTEAETDEDLERVVEATMNGWETELRAAVGVLEWV